MLGDAVTALIAAGFTTATARDFYHTHKMNRTLEPKNPLFDRIISALAAGTQFTADMIVGLFRILVLFGFVSMKSIKTLTEYIWSLVPALRIQQVKQL